MVLSIPSQKCSFLTSLFRLNIVITQCVKDSFKCAVACITFSKDMRQIILQEKDFADWFERYWGKYMR